MGASGSFQTSRHSNARSIATRRSSRRHFLRAGLGVGGAFLAARAGIARAEPIDYRWVATKRAIPLRLDADGNDVRWLPRGTLLRVAAGAQGQRLWAWCPAFGRFGSVEAASVEDAPMPSEAEILAQQTGPVLPPATIVAELPARIVGAGKVRTWPEGRPDTLVRELYHNAPVKVLELVEGEDGEPWFRVADDAGGAKAPRGAAFFIHSSFVRVPRTDFHPLAPNPDRTPAGKWFEADLQIPAMLTAYEDGRAVFSSLTLYGRQPDVTPMGDFNILWRVANETMTSERVYPPIPRNAPGGYYLTGVLYTQYFTRTGAAIHYNYWSSNWGYQGSRGCLGMPLAESKWAWDWAEAGTPITVFS